MKNYSVKNQLLSYINNADTLTDAAFCVAGGVSKPKERLIIAGNGVNHAAALASKEAFIMYSGLSGERIETITCAELLGYRLAPDTTVIIIDMAGEFQTSKTAADFAIEQKASAIVLSKQPFVTEDTSAFTLTPNDTFCSGFGGGGDYFSALLHLLALSTAMSADRHKTDTLKDEIKNYITSYGEVIDVIDGKAKLLSEKMAKTKNYEMIGSGTDYAAASLARTVAFRELGVVSTVEETEDWLHVNMLQVDVSRFGPVFFLSNCNPAKDRALRTLRYVRELRDFTVLITDVDEGEIYSDADIIPVPKTAVQAVSPLMLFSSASLLLSHIREGGQGE